MILTKDSFTEKDGHLEILISEKVVKIDKRDLWIVEEFKNWNIKKGHVSCRRSVHTEYGAISQSVYLHKLVTRTYGIQGSQVDHISRDGFDNRRENLRFATPRQNNFNKGPSKGKLFKGVVERRNKASNKFVAYFRHGKGSNNLGHFFTVEEAAFLYDLNASVHHGEFAYLNFPEKKEEYSELAKKIGLDSGNIAIQCKGSIVAKDTTFSSAYSMRKKREE